MHKGSDRIYLLYLLGLALWEFLVDHLLLEDPEGGNKRTNMSLAFQCVTVSELPEEQFLNKETLGTGEPLSRFD